MKEDPALKDHLGLFGINIDAVEKTEKSMAELVRYYYFLALLISL